MLKLIEENNLDWDLIDIFRLKNFDLKVFKQIKNLRKVISVEEHLMNFGIGSILSELITIIN